MPTHNTKRIDIALQGGGAHGAFTWGVLDRLLEDERIEIVGISGTSAGAMNAVALAQGLADGGPQAAQELLEGFWTKVSDAARLSPIQRSFFDIMMGRWSLDLSPSFILSQHLMRAFSPYEFNPFMGPPVWGAFPIGTRITVGDIRVWMSAQEVTAAHNNTVFRVGEIGGCGDLGQTRLC